MHEEEYSYINSIFKNELDNEIVNSYLLFANKLMSFLDFIIKFAIIHITVNTPTMYTV